MLDFEFFQFTIFDFLLLSVFTRTYAVGRRASWNPAWIKKHHDGRDQNDLIWFPCVSQEKGHTRSVHGWFSVVLVVGSSLVWLSWRRETGMVLHSTLRTALPGFSLTHRMSQHSLLSFLCLWNVFIQPAYHLWMLPGFALCCPFPNCFAFHTLATCFLG